MSVAPESIPVALHADRSRYLYGPVADFLLLGGGSLIALLLLRMVLSGEDGRMLSLAATLAIANVINHPHFAHSYQIFYSNFGEKLRSSRYPVELRRRYFQIGVVAPILLVVGLAWCVGAQQPRLLGLAANVMFLLVGWHYVKQGYGMAMVDAALKRAYFSEVEKKHLLSNAYATWIFSWLLINHMIAGSERSYFGIEYFVIPVPLWLLAVAGAVGLLTALKLYSSLWARHAAGRPIAWNGIIAYTVTLYAWLLFRDPVILLWVPMFHSLQYLAVVWRFQGNKISKTSSQVMGPKLRMTVFLVAGFVLGYLGFWIVPEWLDVAVPYDKELFGASLFMYLFWIFINVHHYLLDTVMWRKGNPDVAEHLFGR